MSVDEAEEFFGDGDARTPAAHTILDRLADVGLGYLTLGQPLTTLSGGERQRLKLAIHMADKGGVYVLDEPTTGLHLADVEQLLGLLDRLVDAGNSVIVIEHHQAVMAHADWIIDLGPGAGHDGGRIVFEGTPADLVAARSTLTGEHLATYVDASTVELPAAAGPSAYEAARRPALARFADARPAEIARCASASDVAEALALARGRPLAVRSGGHCFAGRSSTGGVLIDVAPMDGVEIGDGRCAWAPERGSGGSTTPWTRTAARSRAAAGRRSGSRACCWAAASACWGGCTG